MIKTRLTRPATRTGILITCPSCNTRLFRQVGIRKKQGKDSCGICGAKFEWQIIKTIETKSDKGEG